jgi:predicted GIY-YIG superfamily endonuclease
VNVAFYTYMLRCSDGSYYTGHTDNIEARLYAHENGVLKGYTSSRRPVKLVWCEMFATRDEAFQSEWMVKGWRRSKKDALVAGDWREIIRQAAVRAETRLDISEGEPSVDDAAFTHPARTSG